MKTTLLVDTESFAIMDAHFTTKKAYDGHIGLQVFRRNAEDLQAFLADKMYSWSDLREACREESTRPVIKHCEQNALKKAHNARIDDDVYNQRSISETVFAMRKDDGDEIRSRSCTSSGNSRASASCITSRRRRGRLAACSPSPDVFGRGIVIVHLLLCAVSCETDVLITAQVG